MSPGVVKNDERILSAWQWNLAKPPKNDQILACR